jgi:hypothetical protein
MREQTFCSLGNLLFKFHARMELLRHCQKQFLLSSIFKQKRAIFQADNTSEVLIGYTESVETDVLLTYS